ncbi:hypothetical protein AK51_12095 [Serratia nematodiphila DZ0503SBS1]|nr:hypothetical protein AK51_12095 [Serratia nematodiphila DZ0503SBS1]
MKVSAVSAAAAGMIGGIAKNAAADDHRNIVPPSSYQPPADAQHLYKYKFTDSKKRSLPSGWRAKPPSSNSRSPRAWPAST